MRKGRTSHLVIPSEPFGAQLKTSLLFRYPIFLLSTNINYISVSTFSPGFFFLNHRKIINSDTGKKSHEVLFMVQQLSSYKLKQQTTQSPNITRKPNSFFVSCIVTIVLFIHLHSQHFRCLTCLCSPAITNGALQPISPILFL